MTKAKIQAELKKLNEKIDKLIIEGKSYTHLCPKHRRLVAILSK